MESMEGAQVGGAAPGPTLGEAGLRGRNVPDDDGAGEAVLGR